MKTIETSGTVSPDGILTIHVPKDIPAGQHTVVVVIDDQIAAPEAVDERGWPIGFCEATFGSLADDPIERGDQGTYEVREAIE